jgi:5-methylcytosine-specific restriction protein A
MLGSTLAQVGSAPMTACSPKRITGRRLQERRERKRRENPLCVHCEANGITRIWTQLDHTIALEHGGPDTYENTQGLCDACHDVKTLEQTTKRRGGAKTF